MDAKSISLKHLHHVHNAEWHIECEPGAFAEPVGADMRVAAHRAAGAQSREQLVVQKVAFHVARAFGDIEMNRVTPPTCTRVLLTAHQVVIVPARATTWPVVGLREVLCADIAHRKQVCDVEVLRSRDGERCLVATIAAGDVDMCIPRPPALRGKIAPPFETQFDVCNVGPGTSTRRLRWRYSGPRVAMTS